MAVINECARVGKGESDEMKIVVDMVQVLQSCCGNVDSSLLKAQGQNLNAKSAALGEMKDVVQGLASKIGSVETEVNNT